MALFIRGHFDVFVVSRGRRTAVTWPIFGNRSTPRRCRLPPLVRCHPRPSFQSRQRLSPCTAARSRLRHRCRALSVAVAASTSKSTTTLFVIILTLLHGGLPLLAALRRGRRRQPPHWRIIQSNSQQQQPPTSLPFTRWRHGSSTSSMFSTPFSRHLRTTMLTFRCLVGDLDQGKEHGGQKWGHETNTFTSRIWRLAVHSVQYSVWGFNRV